MSLLAAKGGHLEVLKYASENGCLWHRHTAWKAAEGGRLEVLKYAHKIGKELSNVPLCQIARDSNNEKMIQWAHANGIRCTCHL